MRENVVRCHVVITSVLVALSSSPEVRAEWVISGYFGKADTPTADVRAESRKFAVEFLEEAQQRLDDDLHALFDRAISQYDIVARNLKTVSDAYPFQQCQDAPVATDDRARATAGVLAETRDAEATGLDILAELVAELQGLSRARLSISRSVASGGAALL